MIFLFWHMQSLHAEKQVLQETVVKQEKTIADLRQATAHVGKRPDVDWKRLEEEQVSTINLLSSL